MNENDELSSDLARTAVVAADTRLPEVYLLVVEGEFSGRRFRLHKQRMVIGAAGRGANNDIDLALPTLSAQHASVELSIDGQVRIQDLNSSNGTYLNDVVLEAGEAREVEEGDEIGLGPDLVFQLTRSRSTNAEAELESARGAVGSSSKRGRPASDDSARETETSNQPPGISSDVPLGKILGYLLSAGIVACTLFGVLNDTLDFMGILKSFFGGRDPG